SDPSVSGVVTGGRTSSESLRVRGAYRRGPRRKVRFSFAPRMILLGAERAGLEGSCLPSSRRPREIEKRREGSLPAFSVNSWVGRFRCRLVQLPEWGALRTLF